MKKIDESMVKKLAYEERLCLYRLAQRKELDPEEISGALHLVEDLTEINLNSKNFNARSISVLGIENCCKFFKSLCEQYSDLITKGEDGDYIARQKRMDIVIESPYQGIKPRTMDIGLYDAATIIDEIRKENCHEIHSTSMKGNDIQHVNIYATYYTFASMYYAIRDLIEGKSYYDGQFFTEHRVLPAEYEKDSQELIGAFMQRANISSREDAKNQLIATLNEGVSVLGNMQDVLKQKKI